MSLTNEERSICLQMNISEADFVRSRNEDMAAKPNRFVGFNEFSPPAPGAGEPIYNGATIHVSPGSTYLGAAEGVVSFVGTGALMGGNTVTITPGYANDPEPLVGVITSGSTGNQAARTPKEIHAGDIVTIVAQRMGGEVSRTASGTLSIVSSAPVAAGSASTARASMARSSSPTRGLGAVLTELQLSVCRQMKIEPSEYAASFAEDNPAEFAIAAASVRVGSVTPVGIKSGTRVEIDPGNVTRGPTKGALEFKNSSSDGLLRNGNHVDITPGDSNGIVSGMIWVRGASGDPNEADDRPIQSGDTVYIDVIGKCFGVLTVAGADAQAQAHATASKARLGVAVRERDALRAEIAKMKPSAASGAASGAKTGAKTGATTTAKTGAKEWWMHPTMAEREAAKFLHDAEAIRLGTNGRNGW